MASDIQCKLGQRIRQLRKDRGWRQLDLAAQAGITENYVSDLELGRKEACLKMLNTLANAFEISLEALFKSVE